MSQPLSPPALSSAAAAAARAALLASALAALGGCQALSGGGGGVMPASDVGPPPSLRSSFPNQASRQANVDDEGRPLQTAPTRRLDLPKSAGGQTRAAETSERRIRREDLEGNGAAGSSGGGLSPAMTPGGGVGLGGKV